MNNRNLKVLIIRFSSIGDIMLTTPVIRCLKKQTGAKIHFLTKKEYLPLLEANPYLDKIITIENNLQEVIKDLRTESYSLILDLHRNLRSFAVRQLLRCNTVSFDKQNFKKWLLVNLKIRSLKVPSIVHRYMEAIETIGVRNDGEGLDYFFPENFVLNLRIEKLIGEQLKTGFFAFCIGGAHFTKRMPPSKIENVCSSLDIPVLLLGGTNEKIAGDYIASAAGSHVYNLCGELTLHESSEIIRRSRAVISHDTGMMHIAAAFQKEILSIWGNTVPAFGMHPYYKNGVERNTVFEVAGLSCRPCSKIGFDKCPRGHFKCMQDISVSGILEKLKGLKINAIH
jgi:ADP-heptose:LPS heptosyltransferase